MSQSLETVHILNIQWENGEVKISSTMPLPSFGCSYPITPEKVSEIMNYQEKETQKILAQIPALTKEGIPWYDVGNTTKGEKQMSFLGAVKTDQFAMILADTREVNSRDEIISDKTKKVLSFPDKSTLVGYTGRYTFMGRHLSDWIGSLMQQASSADIMGEVERTAELLQPELEPGQSTNLHVIQVRNYRIQYVVYDMMPGSIKKTTWMNPVLVYSGVNTVQEDWNIPLSSSAEEIQQKLEQAVYRKIESPSDKTVGGYVFGYMITSEGRITEIGKRE